MQTDTQISSGSFQLKHEAVREAKEVFKTNRTSYFRTQQLHTSNS